VERGDGSVGRRDGSVEGSGPRSGSSNSDLESNTDELIEDWDWKDDVETLDGVLSSDEGVKEIDKLDEGRDRGDREMNGPRTVVTGDDVSGIVLRRSNDERRDPLGLKKDVSKDVSGPSGRARDLTDGDACNTDDS
jgi:hypothetical protein